MNHIDIPKDTILSQIQDNVIEEIEKATAAIGQKAEVEKLEWTSEGIRIWLK